MNVLVRKRGDIDLMASDFQCLILEFDLKGFVVGYPFNRQRRNTPDSEQVKRFIDEMSKIGKLEGLEYTYWDKEFISKDVELFLKNFSLPQFERKEMEYKFAAVELLQVTSLLSLRYSV
ncbi:hypothetical protein Pint_16711 [Pistacia integerrima]|uniref:Uncharacterized protein n=1 Tax=Pistacia integerrima TaxID=434235 RepID=A0ACC0ZEB2_9ROSI|nr:hypothetical protein Pint_16711 [Pistacia integerrima]